MTAPEFSRPTPIRRLAETETTIAIAATEAERAALARRLDLPAIAALAAEFRLRPLPGGRIAAHLALSADLTQICVVTLDPFPVALRESAVLRFVPAGAEANDSDPEAPDEIPYTGETIDLGEAAAEQLALALDPWPRKPGLAQGNEPGSEPAAPRPLAEQLTRSPAYRRPPRSPGR
ncbi:MAG: DUF177 domain-containing protein [Rhodospirillales bacterium]|nr:DUF177 domain-containing protein [Rhodospirillales bacterium]